MKAAVQPRKEDVALLVASPLFDAEWYVSRYEDARNCDSGAAEHYLCQGAASLYDPGPEFSTSLYLEANPDVRAHGMNALVHYLRYGRAEGRRLGPADTSSSSAKVERDVKTISATSLFDRNYYLRKNDDVASNGMDPLVHYVEHGANEGRWPNPYFDNDHYRGLYQQPEDDTNPLAHYISERGTDNFRTSSRFDGGFYSARYADVPPSGLKPLEHFLIFGVRENRQVLAPTSAHDAVPHLIDCRTRRATIILPIHNAPDALVDCIHSVLRHTELGEIDRLLLIDDASSDPRVGRVLGALEGLPGIAIIRHAVNLGYTRTVNEGGRWSGQDDVVLLNSDTVVSPHWLRNLKLAAHRHPRTGTVTAVSDNAGAFSVPESGRNAVDAAVGTDALARAVATAASLTLIEVPTGNGFCLYIKRALLDAIGEFDEASFPEGYGEENEFCMRAIAHGWSNVIAADVYVRHRGSASFGTRKQALAQSGMQRVRTLYPQYDGAIAAIAASPTFATTRYRIAKAMESLDAASPTSKPRIMYVISTRVGGVPQSNRDLMQALGDIYDCYALCCDRSTVELLQVAGTDYRVLERFPLRDPITFATHVSGEYDDIVRVILVRYGIDLLHVRHLAWHSLGLIAIARSLGVPVVYSFHDYYSICPSVNLLDRDGKFFAMGVSTNGDNPLWHFDETAKSITPEYLKLWQARMQEVLVQCDAFVTTSSSTRDLICRALPRVAARSEDFHVIEHGRDFDGFNMHADPGGVPDDVPLRILLPGNIRLHKGMELVRSVKRIDIRGLVEFHLLGSCDPELSDYVLNHGEYQRSDFQRHAMKIRPHIAVILSLVPETYCHVLTECWASGVPVVGIDLGAVGERIRGYGGGWLVSPNVTAEELYERLLEIRAAEVDRQQKVHEVRLWQQGAGTLNDTRRMAVKYMDLYRETVLTRRVEARASGARTALIWESPTPSGADSSMKARTEWVARQFGQPVDMLPWHALLRAEVADYSIVVMHPRAVPEGRRELILATLRSQQDVGVYVLEDDNQASEPRGITSESVMGEPTVSRLL